MLDRFAARTATFLITLLVFTCARSSADGLNVSPIRVDLSNNERSAALTITNQNDTTELLRVEGDTWDQNSGNDAYALSSNQLFIVPPVLSIDPGQSKMVRLALLEAADSPRERAFRIFITQVPSELHEAGEVQIAFRVGIPIFVTTATPASAAKLSSAPALAWTAKLDGRRRIHLSVQNVGNTHVHIDAVHIYADASQRQLVGTVTLSDYVLAGAARTFDLTAPADLVSPSIVVQGSDTGEHSFLAAVPVAGK